MTAQEGSKRPDIDWGAGVHKPTEGHIGCTKIMSEVCPVNNFKSMLTRHRRLLGPAALALAVAAIFWVVNSPAIVGVSASARKLPIYSVQRDNKAVSLTFDAAWGDVRVGQ